MQAEGIHRRWSWEWLARGNFYVLAFLSAWLCVSSQVKFAEVQLLEIIYALDGFLIVAWLLFHHDRIRLLRPLFNIGLRWFVFLVLAVVLALVALQHDFYVSENVSILKQPFVVTMSRSGELVLDIGVMLALASQFIEDRRLCRFATMQFYWAGMAGCVYGFISFLGWTFFHVAMGGLGPGARIDGFNNEGGPFGVYAVTVICATAAAETQGWMSKTQMRLSIGFMFFCVIESLSKSALIEVALLIVIIALLRMSAVKSISVVLATVAGTFILFSALGLTDRVTAYFTIADSYEVISQTRPKDGNFVLGRAAGIFLAPRMIAAHPLAGIGWGNYPIVRDDPQYRRGSPAVNAALDAPTLGPIDYIVELGLPLFCYLTWVQIVPAFTLLRKGAPTAIVCLVLLLPISIWSGAHLNFTYPWIGVALALGMFYFQGDRYPGSMSPASTSR
ncbi:hypothetical protein SAMN05443244_1498 [Terriglobus roseus]|uniref:O-Antigen ligase n=2 Tax=Terriglobus roseus TaxID=392734 RepID=A0A1H4L8L4_9BACT|nr:hypothetical protein SAMN05443244_1498 [Terriglobus roseus]